MGQLSLSLIREVSKSGTSFPEANLVIVMSSVLRQWQCPFFVANNYIYMVISSLLCYYSGVGFVFLPVFRHNYTFALSKRHRGFVVRQSVGFRSK